jgi:drug/metabolite transporter (DMT)-like permease
MRAVGYAMVTAGAVMWGFNGPASRMVLDAGIAPDQLAGWRVLAAAVLMTAVLGVLRRIRFRCSRRAFVSIAAFGLLGVALPQLLYYEAISRFDVGLTLVIVYTAPLWVAGIHRVTRGTRQPRQVSAAMALALVGVSVAVLGGGGLSSGSLVGLVLAVSTSLAYAGQLILTDRLDQSLPASSRLALSMICGGVFWLVLPAVRHLPGGLLRSDVPFGDLDVKVPMLLLIAYVVVGGTIGPYALLVGGVARIGPVAAGVTGMIEPLVAITLGWALLGQSLTLIQGMGITLVLACVLASERMRSRALAVPA